MSTKWLQRKKVAGKLFPFSDLYEHTDIDPKDHREYYMQEALDRFFFDAFFMLHMNRVHGDYLEFGSGSNVRSFRFALKYNRLEEFGNRMLYSFDSFEGLPEPTGIDKHQQWNKGGMAVSIDQFRQILSTYGATDGQDYKTIKGFYDQTLSNSDPNKIGISKAAFVHIDCDLYESTRLCLDYITDILVNGSVLSFDDWFCFDGDPNRGEQRAFHEWSKANAASMQFIPYSKFGWHGMSFLVKRKDIRRNRWFFSFLGNSN